MNQAPYPGCNQARSSAEAFALHAGVCRVQSVAVQHCHDAYGLVLEHGSGWKLVFSGDTRPCPALERAGADCTLLIHEATFDSALAHQAVQKRHSTISEAIGVATKMRAYRTILTHFSQRYAKLPAGIELEGPAASAIMIAFDGMTVALQQLPDLPALLPAVAAALDPPQTELHV